MVLMEQWPGFRVAFNQFHLRDWRGRTTTPPVFGEARRDVADDSSSASFSSGIVDFEIDDVALPLLTSTSTTTAPCPRPRGPRLTFFSSAGGSKPNIVHCDGVCAYHQIVARHVKMLYDKGFLPTSATIFTSPRVHRVSGHGDSVFLATGQEGQSGQPMWCLTPQWHELLPLFAEFGLGEILKRDGKTGPRRVWQ